ncbi:protein SERAC1-like [Acanthaster planci]|uniref:Protein SERAC1 n=1 Tax=Acanthaster planci TaxID=133434 RepID=A0A8B7YZ01_ACAPL|nr:protein SERAC1-like [Acanthaster planci]XP_022097730.1 protein SERAC1-like [Acanthaster planci]XP_022097731.1 protein SERAC1-like [Acanthaster planci]
MFNFVCRRNLSSKLKTEAAAKGWRGKLRGVAVVATVGIGGGIILYREWLRLDRALNYKMDPSIPDQRHTYIYITPTPPADDLVAQMRSKVKWRLSILEHFLEDKHPDVLSKLPLDRTNDDPWRLLKRAQFDNPQRRRTAVAKLAKKHHWIDAEYRAIAQACDQRTLIGLARSADVDARFFLAPPSLEDSKESREEGFKRLLGALPRDRIDRCTEFFTLRAMAEGKTVQAHDQSGMLSFGGNTLTFVTGLSKIPEEAREAVNLQALVSHSEVPSHCEEIVKLGGLQLLMKLCMSKAAVGSLKVQCYIARILANMALNEHLHIKIVQAGWVTVLASWMKSNYIPLAAHAARALINLDRDGATEKLDDGIFLLHPQTRTRQVLEADVVFVHGLLGGAFKTWRQQDKANKETKEPQREEAKEDEMSPADEKWTDCWPKTWLAKDCPHMRVLTISYDTHMSEWSAKCPFESEKRSLANRSTEILNKLHRAGVGQRPIIWVSHSMGGLLVKQMLLDACERSELQEVADQTHGVVFFSTPHHGSALAAASQQAKLLIYPSVEVKELIQDSPSLKNLHGRFRAFVQSRRLPVLSFGETKPMSIGLGVKTVVVPVESSHPGYGEYHSLDVNHLEICKPPSQRSLLYQLTLRFINHAVPRSLPHVLSERLREDLDGEDTAEVFYPLGMSFGE